MKAFELAWMGGSAERHFRKSRPGIDDLPWGTLAPSDYPVELVSRARAAWTESAFNEHCTAAAFSELLAAMLAANAPIDLIGMAGGFVADEMVHVELNARLAMELGGGAPLEVDFDALVPRPSRRRTPLERAAELAIRTCCVGETYSVPMLAGAMRAATHPLTRAVLERIVKDEAPHARLGWLFLEWADAFMSDATRTRLAAVVVDCLEGYRHYWSEAASEPVVSDVTPEGFRLADVHALGWMEAGAYARAARRTMRQDVLVPLSRFGIEPSAATVARLLG